MSIIFAVCSWQPYKWEARTGQKGSERTWGDSGQGAADTAQSAQTVCTRPPSQDQEGKMEACNHFIE